MQMGDVNGDGKVNLADALLALKVVAGNPPAGLNLGADVNGDGKIGMAEIIYILQVVTGLRNTVANITCHLCRPIKDLIIVSSTQSRDCQGAFPVAYACGSDWNFGRNKDQAPFFQ
jgi:hypothetical protein